jgi:PAS domain S-box-containing protein
MAQDKKNIANVLLESIPDTAALIDADGNVLMINKAAAESLGRSVDEIIGKNAREILFGDVYEFRRSKWNQVVQTGKTCHFEDERDGKYFETWFCPVFDENGKVESIAVFAHDITKPKKTEKALRQSEEKFRLAMEATNDALWDWNLNTNDVYRNPRHATMLGYEPHELITSQDEWEKRIHPDDRQALFQIVDEHIAGKRDSIEIEYRLKTKPGDYVWILGRGKIVAYNKDGSPARMIGTNIDITERKNLLERNDIILKTCNDGFWLIDTQGRILEVNDAYCRMSGYNRDELLTMSIKDVEAEEEPEEILQHIQEVIGKGFHRFESRHRRKDGTIMDLDICSNYLEYDGGRVFTFFRDITATKQVEKEVRKFKTIADKAGHGVAIAGLEGNLVYVNDSFAQMHQYSVDELIGKNLSIFHNDEQMAHVNKLNDQLKQTGSYVAEEVWHKKRDNTVFPTLMSATLVTDEGGEPLFMAATAIDITKHKKAEELLRYSEERYRSVVEDSPVLLCSFLPDGEIVFANTAYCTYFGKSSMELIGSNFKHLIPEADRQAVIDNIMSLTVDSPTMTHEHKVYSPDGQIRWQRWTNRALFDEHSRAVSFQAFGEDITDRKNMEEALQESELRYHTLFEILPVGVGLSTLDGRIIDANSTFQQMIGYSTEEMRRINVKDTYHNPQERDPYLKQLQQDGFVHGYEVQLKRKDGTIILASLNSTTMKIHNETVIGTVATDITEQKWMEKALAESEEKYRTLVEGAGDPIFTVDEKGVFLFANKVAAETVGLQQEGLVGKTLWDIFSKDTADRQAANVREVIETGQGINRISLTEVQNKSRWYSTTIEPLRNERGRATAVMVIARDVDDMKRAEEQIKMLSSAVESSISGIAIGDAEGNLTYVNHALLEMWGYDNENEVLGRNAVEFWEDEIEGAKVLEKVQNNGSWIGELKAKRKNGSSFDVQVCGTLVKDENGRPISMMGSFIDITESKRREEELTKYREQMARAEQLASLGTLSATVAHQLTQPLTVIRLSIDNALDELAALSYSGNVTRKLQESLTQLSNITSKIENFRNFARKSSGRTVAEVNLKVVAVRIIRLLSESARSANIILRIRNMDDLPCPWMNENDLEQLFFALIENAIQAADGKKNQQLVISGAAQDKHIELQFSDNCGGIEPENIDKIFEPFFSTKPRGQGTGLGLCIVKDIVSRIGGHIRTESKPGEGTTFIINIPVDIDNIS